MPDSKHTDAVVPLLPAVLLQSGSKVERWIKQEPLLIHRLLKNLPYHQLKYIVAYLHKMLSKLQ